MKWYYKAKNIISNIILLSRKSLKEKGILAAAMSSGTVEYFQLEGTKDEVRS